jgi:hypothetical protein
METKLSPEKKEKFEIEEKIGDILSKIVSNPNFVPLATAFALSAAGITLSLSGVDHSHMAFAVKHAAGCHHGTGVCPTHAIFWLRDK